MDKVSNDNDRALRAEIDRLHSTYGSRLEATEREIVRLTDLSQALQGEVDGLSDRLIEINDEAAKVWTLVPAWIQRREIIKSISWEASRFPTGYVAIRASSDFRGVLSAIEVVTDYQDDPEAMLRTIRQKIEELTSVIIYDLFTVHEINDNDSNKRRARNG